MRLSLPTKKQAFLWTLRVLGVLFLSALANGVWQSLLGPAIHFSTRWVLDIASLGLTSYKNGVYQQVAADNQSSVGVETFGWVLLFSGMTISFAMGRALRITKESRSESQLLLQKLSDTPPNSKPDDTPDTLRQEIATILKSVERGRWFLYSASLFLAVLLVSRFISLTRLSYVSSADSHYHQVMHIVSPYLDAREQAQVESDFAQIGSREDYVSLLSRLEGECEAHGKTVPKFDPW